MTRTITVQIGWVALAVAILASIAVVAVALDDILANTVGPPAPVTVTVWPQVVHTVDGTPTTVHPEDLDR